MADDNYNEATASYELTVAPTLTFVTTTISNQTYNINEAIANLTLPDANGGTPTLSYALTPLPVGLAFPQPASSVADRPSS